jgi:hypothetical protein
MPAARWGSTWTAGELTKWNLVRHWGPRSLDTMRTFLAAIVVLP